MTIFSAFEHAKAKTQQWLAPPVFDSNMAKTRQAEVTNAAILVITAFTTLVFMGNLLGGRTPLPIMLIDLFIIGLCIFAQSQLRKGRVKFTGVGIIVLGAILLPMVIASLGTVRTPSTALYLPLVIIAGLLFDRTGILITSILSSLEVGGLIVTENMGILPKPDYSVNITQWVTYTILFGLTGGLVSIATRTTKQALIRAEKELIERRQAEDLLKQTRNNYETFFNSIDEFLFVLDEKGNILHTNKTVTDRLGYSTEELLRQSVLMVHPPERREEAGKIVSEMLAGTAEFCPVPIMTKSGERIPVETRVTPRFWDGRPAIFGVTKDMSQIKFSEEKFSKAFHSSPTLMALSRFEDGKYIDVNEAFLGALGFSREEVIGKTSKELGVFLDISQRNAVIEMVRQKKTVRNIDVTVRTKDGSLRNGLFSVDTIYIGKDLCLLTVMVDITERRQTEEALRESEKRYRSLFEQTHDAVFILDFEGHHLDTNQRAADMLGYSLEEVKKLSVNETSGEREKSRKVIQRLLAGETIPIYERLFRRKDGHVFPAEVNVELVRDSNGNPLHIQSVVRDISQRKQTEEALHVAHDELQKRVRDVEQLRDELREQALRDPLTGLYNRRYLSENLSREAIRTKRLKQPLSIIVIDVDHFKKINDTYGHQVGDLFLKEISNLIKNHARGYDFVCRYGGEEFLLVLPGANTIDAFTRADEIRQRCAALIFLHDGKELHVTTSMGVATYPNHDADVERVIIKADRALYHSKNAGRNQVTVWNENQSP